MTPPKLASDLLEDIQPIGMCLEPCRGDGAFYRVFPTKKDWCEIEEGKDFFDYTTRVGWIITNPPWSKFRLFLSHSLTLAPDVVLMATVNHFWTKARVREVLDRGFGYKKLYLISTPATFPATGFQLGVMHVSSGYEGALEIIDWRERCY